MKNRFEYIPHLLTALRGLIATGLIWDAYDKSISDWFIFAFLVGVLSDMLDGEVLRRLKISRINLKLLDSVMDAIFYMAVFVCMWLVRPEIIQLFIVPIGILLVTQTISWVFSLVKYGKTTSYHSYLAKIWGMTLLIGTVGFFVGQYQFFLFSIFIGILSTIEDIIITALMPHWQCDIASIKVARELRRKAIGFIQANDLP